MPYLGTERFLTDVLEEHLEALGSLLQLRETVLHRRTENLRRLSDLDERIAAHADGLVLAGAEALPILAAGLKGDPPAPSAAVHALLRMEPSASRMAVEALREADPKQLPALGLAFCWSPVESVETELREFAASGASQLSATAAEILSFHGTHAPLAGVLEACCSHAAADVRLAAWRAFSLSGSAPESEILQATRADPDPRVRSAALHAAVWSRQPWLLEECRRAASRPEASGFGLLRLLGILGEAADLARVKVIAGETSLGARRWDVLGSFGHPETLELLVAALDDPDPREAVASARAFSKILGVEIESDRQAVLPPESGPPPDPFEAEFLEQANLPDVALARQHLERQRSRLAAGQRWGRGQDLGAGAGAEIADGLDLESRREACLRGRYRGVWSVGPALLARFPQPAHKESPG